MKGFTLEALGKIVGTGKAAVSKWENDPDINIELATFFKLADALDIDPRELATGAPQKTRELAPHRLSLINAYGRLPPDVRIPIRGLIETLDAAGAARYAEWSKDRQVEAEIRDKKRKEREKT